MCNNLHSILPYRQHHHHHHHSLRMYFIDFLSISFSCIQLLLLLLLLRSLRPCRIIFIPEIDVLINGTWKRTLKIVIVISIIISISKWYCLWGDLRKWQKASSWALSRYYPLKVIDTEKIRKLKSSLELACPLNRHAADKVGKFNRSFLRWTLFSQFSPR